MKQELAVQKISESLKKDKRVHAIFLKGSMGRNEHDEFSDVDLYCLVKEADESEFLQDRITHLSSYKSIKFYEHIFIIAPQTIAVFEDFLHVDLFTVTEKTFKKKDYFKVLYDPDGRLEQFKKTQDLCLSQGEYEDCVYDVAWYLFQYHKAARRRNDLWAVDMLRYVFGNLARVLLHRYSPDRAQLGIKALEQELPVEVLLKVKEISNLMTPNQHLNSVACLVRLLADELDWLQGQLGKETQAGEFLLEMVGVLHEWKG
ncbi:Nucleotidyltransferase domain protein [Bacillus sp. THAF10]|uniref:nucleotidyltransferase domain-containing protein n=1 Tax=Bacillus sp. THAF10 TaxID=2587848 RepID=UPI001267E63F|nr:nucleotidyltransferase domain-containing protein [Bacillus sp. THAF10]QFT87947.1 Nucleotidyltransferase domain protein [Bacillus sp. THAF10]